MQAACSSVSYWARLRCGVRSSRQPVSAFAAPLAIWSIPMFDATAAILRRKLTGRSIYSTDRGHIHHVLLTRGMNAGQAVALITGLCVVTSAGAMISLYYDIEWFGVVVVAVVIALLAATRVFGHVEFLLVNARLFGFGRHLSPLASRGRRGMRHATLNIQGTRRWEGLWSGLVESADRFQLVKMQLNLSLPRLHEEFFATWSRDGRHRKETLWQAEIPLVIDEISVGRLGVSGLQHAASACTEMSEFLDFIETFESQLAALIRQQDASEEDASYEAESVNSEELSDHQPVPRQVAAPVQE